MHGTELVGGSSCLTPLTTLPIPVCGGWKKGRLAIAEEEEEEEEEDLLQSRPHVGTDPHGLDLLLTSTTAAAPESRKTNQLAFFEEEEEADSPEAAPKTGACVRGMDWHAGGPNQSGTHSLACTPVPRHSGGGNVANPVAEEEEEADSPEAVPKTGVCMRGTDWHAGGPNQSGTLSMACTPVPSRSGGGNVANPVAEEEEEDSPEPVASVRKV